MIVFVPGRIPCPLAGLGTRAANASNRLVVDSPASATIDGTTITLHDDRDCAPNTVIADLVWLAAGPAPLTIHLEVTKTGHDWAIDLHTHEPRPIARDRRERISYEPIEVVAADRGKRRVLVDHKRLSDAVIRVPLARRLAGKLATMRDHLGDTRQDPAAPGYRFFDRSVGIGIAGAASFLVRATLTSLAASNAPLIAQGDLAEMLREGSWELALETLSDRRVPELVKRDLELLGLGDVPLLADAYTRGLGRGRVLAFRCIPGAAELRLDAATAPFPRALDIAREYLEFHMLGGMLAAAARPAEPS
jgi:hypothetical protein